MRIKCAISGAIWALCLIQLDLLVDAISKSNPPNLVAIIGILVVVILLNIIQFSIKVK